MSEPASLLTMASPAPAEAYTPNAYLSPLAYSDPPLTTVTPPKARASTAVAW